MRNKDSRIAQVRQEIANTLSSGTFSPQASFVRDKLQFAETHTFCSDLQT